VLLEVFSIFFACCATTFSISETLAFSTLTSGFLAFSTTTSGSFLTSTFFSSLTAFTSVLGLTCSSSFLPLLISIFPTVFNSSFSALALNTCCCFFSSSSRLASRLASCCLRNSSCSLRFSSPTSLEATFLDLSVLNPSSKTLLKLYLVLMF